MPAAKKQIQQFVRKYLFINIAKFLLKNKEKIKQTGLSAVESIKKHYKQWKLDALVVLGGNGSNTTAGLLAKEGLNVIGLPKTIDNDIVHTDYTFGFHTAVDIATESIERIHTTAFSHSRVMVVEVMGHKVGWVTLHAGIAGGAGALRLRRRQNHRHGNAELAPRPPVR